jgi:hypothetical protein
MNTKLRMLTKPFLFLFAVSVIGSACLAREWSDASGRHRWKAELLAASEQLLVLRDRKGELQAVEVKELSDDDQAFVAKYLKEPGSSISRDVHTWAMQSGLKVKGQVLGYKSGPVQVENRSGVPYVNGKRFRNIDPIYQAMLPRLIAKTEDASVETIDDFKQWTKTLRREKHSIQVDGVILKLEGGDEYAVPLFLFAERDRAALENGWRQWNAEEATKERKQQEDVLLRAEADEYQRKKEAKEQQRQQIQMMQLGLLAVNAGITSLWEVTMAPGRGVYGRPMKVVVPANNSGEAKRAALQRYPGYIAGPSKQISRR